MSDQTKDLEIRSVQDLGVRRCPPHICINGRKELEAGGKPTSESSLERIVQREVCIGWILDRHADSNASSIKVL